MTVELGDLVEIIDDGHNCREIGNGITYLNNRTKGWRGLIFNIEGRYMEFIGKERQGGNPVSFYNNLQRQNKRIHQNVMEGNIKVL